MSGRVDPGKQDIAQKRYLAWFIGSCAAQRHRGPEILPRNLCLVSLMPDIQKFRHRVKEEPPATKGSSQ